MQVTKSLEEVQVAGNQLSSRTHTDKITDEEKGKVITFTKYKARTSVRYQKHAVTNIRKCAATNSVKAQKQLAVTIVFTF